MRNENFVIGKKEIGMRLDRYLMEKIRNVSRSAIKDMIDAGRIKINGKRVVIAKWEMLEGDEVALRLQGWEPRSAMAKGSSSQMESGALKASSTPQTWARAYVKVVYEDKDVIVVEKPAGIVVQPGSTGERVETYVDQIRSYLKRKYKGRGAHVKPVHRLDKETSGLMVFATSKIGEQLIEQFKQHAVERVYLTIVDGRVPKESGRVDFPIKKGDFGHGRRATIGGKEDGSTAITDYFVMERYSKASLLRLDMKTGRTHQARVHLAAVNHPIVGDNVYGRVGHVMPFARHALHSHVLGFKHPRTGKFLRFKSELPEDMAHLVDELRGS